MLMSSIILPSTESTKPKRQQVKNACIHCQKACKKCDNGRPCQRCIKYNLSDTCRNSERKKRQKGIKRGPYNKLKTQQTKAHGLNMTKQRKDHTQTTDVPLNHAIKQVTLPTSLCSTDNIIDIFSFQQPEELAMVNVSSWNHNLVQPLNEQNDLLWLALKEYHDPLSQQQQQTHLSTNQLMNTQQHNNHFL
ncbi:hypothetical protein EDC96DRAFT_493047 [Choanephora cucurbitarum]|nr:hypothetical protein EDC96DRAFT_493047 [Choanephora cucurbitarum]